MLSAWREAVDEHGRVCEAALCFPRGILVVSVHGMPARYRTGSWSLLEGNALPRLQTRGHSLQSLEVFAETGQPATGVEI